MERNKIKGVKPFNQFFFRSCYYHQLISALSCFGISEDNVLYNAFPVLSEKFGYKIKNIYNEKKLLSYLGCKNQHGILNLDAICKSIDKGNPIIIGIDIYYFESRSDTYLKYHDTHFILMLGYDREKDEAYIVDHDYANGTRYQEKTISLDNLLLAAKYYNKLRGRKRVGCQIIQSNVPALNSQNLHLWEMLPKSVLKNNLEISSRNLSALKDLFSREESMTEQKTQLVHNYLKGISQFYKVYSNNEILQNEDRVSIGKLISGYGILLSVIWKMEVKQDYNVPKEQSDKLISKIDEIMTLEKQVYQILMRL